MPDCSNMCHESSGTALTDDFLQIRLGGDMALFRGIARLMLDAERKNPGTVFDQAFIDEHCGGVNEYLALLDELDFNDVLEATGLSLTEIEQLAETMMSSKRTVLCWAMGWTQHRHSVATIGEGANVLLLRGMIGKPGAGLCPVRGHSNVQGDRTMGIFEKMPESFLGALDKEFGIDSPREHGFDTVHAIGAMSGRQVRVFIGMGGSLRIRRTRRPRGTPGARLPAGRLRHSARKRRGLLSRNQPADPARVCGSQIQHPGVQGGRGPTRTSRHLRWLSTAAGNAPRWLMCEERKRPHTSTSKKFAASRRNA